MVSDKTSLVLPVLLVNLDASFCNAGLSVEADIPSKAKLMFPLRMALLTKGSRGRSSLYTAFSGNLSTYLFMYSSFILSKVALPFAFCSFIRADKATLSNTDSLAFFVKSSALFL